MIRILFKKEIVDILRDKKTILLMVVVPIILYPLLFIGSMLLMNRVASSSTIDTFKICFYKVPEKDEIISFFEDKKDDLNYNLEYVETDGKNLEESIRNGIANVYIGQKELDGKKQFVVFYFSNDNMSLTASNMVTTMLSLYKREVTTVMLENEGLIPEDYLEPFSISQNDIATVEESVGNIFGLTVPFLLITSVLMGAIYPAIDVTAGEKERGTLETILTLPVKSIDIIISKFLATACISVFSAFLNVLSMGIIGGYFFENIQIASGIEFSINSYIPAILITFFAITIFALFASSICLLLCIFAKSFKEAQNYTSPILIVFLLLAMAGILPNIEFNSKTALIPVANVSLLIKDLFQFNFNFGLIVTVLLSTILFTVISILIMTRCFSMESIIFGDQSSGIRILESRSEMKNKQMPGMGDVCLVLSLSLIVLIYLGSIFVAKWGLYGLILQQLLFALIVLAYSWYIKADFVKLFRFRKTNIMSIISGFFIWLGTYILMNLLIMFLASVFPALANDAEDSMNVLTGDAPLLLAVFAMAFIPAVCEELLFRGFVFGALSNKYKMICAVTVSGLLFGIYHMSILKLIPITILGCIFAYVIYKTGSIFVSIWMHFLNNSISTIAMVSPDLISKCFPLLVKESLNIMEIVILVVMGIAFTIIGFILLNLSHKKPKNEVI